MNNLLKEEKIPLIDNVYSGNFYGNIKMLLFNKVNRY